MSIIVKNKTVSAQIVKSSELELGQFRVIGHVLSLWKIYRRLSDQATIRILVGPIGRPYNILIYDKFVLCLQHVSILSNVKLKLQFQLPFLV